MKKLLFLIAMLICTSVLGQQKRISQKECIKQYRELMLTFCDNLALDVNAVCMSLDYHSTVDDKEIKLQENYWFNVNIPKLEGALRARLLKMPVKYTRHVHKKLGHPYYRVVYGNITYQFLVTKYDDVHSELWVQVIRPHRPEDKSE